MVISSVFFFVVFFQLRREQKKNKKNLQTHPETQRHFSSLSLRGGFFLTVFAQKGSLVRRGRWLEALSAERWKHHKLLLCKQSDTSALLVWWLLFAFSPLKSVARSVLVKKKKMSLIFFYRLFFSISLQLFKWEKTENDCPFMELTEKIQKYQFYKSILLLLFASQYVSEQWNQCGKIQNTKLQFRKTIIKYTCF